MLPTETDIDATSGTQYTELVEPLEFPRIIATLASYKDERANEARRHIDGPDEHSFWTERSLLDMERSGACVAWR